MKKIYYLFVLLIAFSSCEKDEVVESSTVEKEIRQADQLERVVFEKLPAAITKYLDNQNYIKQSKNKSSTHFGSIKTNIPANKIISKDGYSSYTIALNNIDNIPTDIYFDNLVIFNYKKQQKIYVLRYEPTEEWYWNSGKFKDFSGVVTFYTIDGTKLNDIVMQNGIMLGKGEKNDALKSPCDFVFTETGTVCTNGGSIVGDENEVGWECTTGYTMSVNCNTGGGGGSSGGSGPSPGNTGGGGGSSDDGGGSGFDDLHDFEYADGTTAPILPPKFEDKINTEDLNNLCVEGIIKELQEKDDHLSVIPDLGTEVSHLSQIILDLFDQSQIYHLKFLIGDLESNVNASTNPEPNLSTGEFTFIITLNQDYVKNGTQLAIARTIIHESLHGYLGYMYQDKPYASLSQLLRTYIIDKGYTKEESQHRLMTEFAEALGASLAAWDNHAIPDPIDPDEKSYYEAMAWSGAMINTDAFDELDQDFKDLILQANRNEGNVISEATEDAKGTTNCN